jgi:hypothetical protein
LLGLIGVVCAAAMLAGGAAGSTASDIYIFGKVRGRVPGKNLADVEVTWWYKCLGDMLGDATYEWTLKAVRLKPKPVQTTVLATGTSKIGKVGVRLSPGEYLLTADPYRCETAFGQSYDEPEIGETLVVPDYCAWSVVGSRGSVQLEQAATVRIARPGDTVRPGDALVTPPSGSVRIVSTGGEGSVSVGSGSRLGVDSAQCGRVGGWLLRLEKGSVIVEVERGAPKGPYVVASPNATSTGTGARWLVSVSGSKPRTSVKALSGSVRVWGKVTARTVVVRAGQSTTVVGTAGPTKPARG